MFFRTIKKITRICQLSIFLPQCRLCDNLLVGDDEQIVCGECEQGVKMINAPLCRRCGRIVASNHLICGECIVHPPIFRRHLSYSIYEGVLKDLILLFKYGEIKSLKKLFARYYVELIEKRVNEKFDFILPVPPDRTRKREFNHIYETAKILSRSLGIKILYGNLIKVKATAPQAGLSREQRIKNLNGAFKLRNPAEVRGKKVLLIDDVYTTGTTVKKCSELLVREKADVLALTLARSI